MMTPTFPDLTPHESRIQALQSFIGQLFETRPSGHARGCTVNGTHFVSAMHAAMALGTGYDTIREACMGRRGSFMSYGKLVPIAAWWDGEPPRATKLKPKPTGGNYEALYSRVTEYLLANPGASYKQIRAEADCSSWTIVRVKKRLGIRSNIGRPPRLPPRNQ